jgi:polyadenylate-binding protein
MKKSERIEFLRNMFERKKADKTARYASGVNLYVKNLDDNIDDEALEKEFSTHGNITSVKVMRDQSGRSKGFGFVCFTYPDEATKAVTEMNGKLIFGKPLYVALAQRKEERRAHLQTQYYQRQLAIRGAPIPGMAPPGAPVFASNINPQAFQHGGPPHLNMYFPQGIPNNPNALAAAQGFFQGVPQRNLIPSVQLARSNWPTNRAGNPGQIRPGPMPYSSIMRPPPQTNQQPRFNPVSNQQRAQMSGPTGQPVPPQSNVPRFPPNASQNRPTHANQVQFTTNARNIQPQQPQVPVVGPPVRPPVNIPPVPADSLEQFMASVRGASSVDQTQLLGERLYSIIQSWYPVQAGKLTGMLLEIDNRELMSMIMENAQTHEEASPLRKKVDSAMHVLSKTQESAAPESTVA